jgi:hypothetical protein
MMRRLTAALLTSVLFAASTQSLLAQPTQVRRAWNDLPRMIEGMEIRMLLPDATRIRGRVLDVRPDALVVDVQRTSNRQLHGKGRTEIPRADVSAIELFQRRSRAANTNAGAIGAGLGGAAVSPLLFYLGETEKISGWGALVIVVGGAVGGAMIANRLHGHPPDVLITVTPD